MRRIREQQALSPRRLLLTERAITRSNYLRARPGREAALCRCYESGDALVDLARAEALRRSRSSAQCSARATRASARRASCASGCAARCSILSATSSSATPWSSKGRRSRTPPRLSPMTTNTDSEGAPQVGARAADLPHGESGRVHDRGEQQLRHVSSCGGPLPLTPDTGECCSAVGRAHQRAAGADELLAAEAIVLDASMVGGRHVLDRPADDEVVLADGIRRPVPLMGFVRRSAVT